MTAMPEVRPGVFWMARPGCKVGQEQPQGRPQCHFCGGTHAIMMPYEKVGKFLDLWTGVKGPLFPMDCMMTRPDFKNFCLQWNLFEPVDHLRRTTSIPKTRKEVTNWHLKFVSTRVTK